MLKTTSDINYPAFVQGVQSDGWDIRLTYQHPTHLILMSCILDLFLQQSKHFLEGTPNNIAEIVKTIDESYQNYPVEPIVFS